MMSVRLGLLALLAEKPMYGAQLRSEFEDRTGGAWRVNVGQVYTTLSRAERDGLVDQHEADAEGRICYRITDEGLAELDRWWCTPVSRESRDELVVKLSFALSGPAERFEGALRAQRADNIRTVCELTRAKAAVADTGRAQDLARELALENQLFATEAEIQWLEHVQNRWNEMRATAARRAQDPQRAGWSRTRRAAG